VHVLNLQVDDRRAVMEYNTEGIGETLLQVLRRPSMKLWTDFYILETIPKDQRASAKMGWWSSVQQGKQVPFAFSRALRLTADVVLVGIAVLIGVTTQAPAMTIAAMEILFVSMGALLLVSRILKHFFLVVGVYLAIIVLGAS
jgi:hypothetical protein